MKNYIDPKNPHTVGKSAWNLGNHTLVIMFIMAIVFVVMASYK
jgi:urease accessory protein UreE